ncbi:MAG: hypothetical protein N3A65_05975 [candidate division WOR-3 bacterium]|nr:hypothetical protein [candidate division WOR-3 bacterium]
MRQKKLNQTQTTKTDKANLFNIFIVLITVIALQSIYILIESKFAGPGFPLDDPWIHMQFAKNIAFGKGFSYNAGEPVAGSTAPLWTILLVPIHWFIQDVNIRIIMVKTLGVLIFLIALVFIYFLSLKIASNKIIALASSLAAGTTSYLNWGAISGLEIPLYVLFTILIIYLNYEMGLKTNRKLYYSIPALIALTVYARPECAILLIFYIIDNILLIPKKQRLIFIIISIFTFGAAMLPYFLFNHALSDSIFPNTFRAKAQENSIFVALSTMNPQHLKWLFFKMAPAYFVQSITHLFKANPLFVYGLFIGSIITIYRKLKNPKNQSVNLMLVFVALLYAPFIGLISPFISADFHNGRYIANQVACGVFLGVMGYYWFFQMIKRRLKGITLKIIAIILIVVAIYNTIFAQVFMIKFSASNVKSINEIQVKTGKWLKEHIPADATVGVNDIGAIAYFSEKKIIDLCGLVNPEIIGYFRRYGDNKLAAYVYVQEKKLQYLAIFPRWFPRLIDTGYYQIIHKIRYDRNFASEWVFVPEVKTYSGLILKSLHVRPIPSEKWILKSK